MPQRASQGATPAEEMGASSPPVAAAGDPAAPSSLLVNSSSLLAARGWSILVTGLLAVYAIRTLPTHEYGRYAVALALVTTFTLFSEMGIGSLALREMSQHPGRQARILGTALSAECLTSLAAVALLVPVALLLDYPAAVLVLVAIGAGTIAFQSLISPLEAIFRARRVYEAAYITVLQSTVTALVGGVLVAIGAGAPALMVALLSGAVVAVPFALVLVRRRLRVRPSFAGAAGTVLPFLTLAAPIALTGLIWVVYERLDVLMLSKLSDLTDVAFYNVPLTIVQYSLLVPAVIGTTLFPILTTALRDDPATGRDTFVLMIRLFLILGGTGTMMLLIGGGDLVTLVFGARYAASAMPMAILSGAVALGFCNLLCWYTLLAGHRERVMVAMMLGALGVKLLLGLALIPRFGPAGAAAAVVISEAGLVACELALIHRRLFRVPIGRILVRPLLAGALAAGVAALITPVSALLAAAVAGSLYAGLLLAVRYVSGPEWQPLTGPLRRGATRLLPGRG